MKLFIASIFLSAVSTNARMAADEMPCASGLLLGKSAAIVTELLRAIDAMIERVLMCTSSGGRVEALLYWNWVGVDGGRPMLYNRWHAGPHGDSVSTRPTPIRRRAGRIDARRPLAGPGRNSDACRAPAKPLLHPGLLVRRARPPPNLWTA